MKHVVVVGVILGSMLFGVLSADCENGQCPYVRGNANAGGNTYTQPNQAANNQKARQDDEVAESDYIDEEDNQGYTVEKVQFTRHGIVESAAPSDKMNSHRIAVPQYFHGSHHCGDCDDNWYEYTDTEWPTKFEDSWMEDLVR